LLRQCLHAKQPLRWSHLEVIERCYRGPMPHRGAR
jgi:hypothetical protein